MNYLLWHSVHAHGPEHGGYGYGGGYAYGGASVDGGGRGMEEM